MENIVYNQVPCYDNQQGANDAGNQHGRIVCQCAVPVSRADAGNHIIAVPLAAAHCIAGIAGFGKKLMEPGFYITPSSEHHIGTDNTGIVIIHRIGIS